MSSTNHLRKINHNRLPGIPSNQNIELVKIAVDKSGTGEFDYYVHQGGVETAWGGVGGYLASAGGWCERVR
jgi:hypothetical protein